jgi:hypothetical protein
LNTFVAHQLHEGWQPKSTVEQFRGPGVPQAVRRDRFAVGASGSFGGIRQFARAAIGGDKLAQESVVVKNCRREDSVMLAPA